jgi:hypothetical protein
VGVEVFAIVPVTDDPGCDTSVPDMRVKFVPHPEILKSANALS